MCIQAIVHEELTLLIREGLQIFEICRVKGVLRSCLLQLLLFAVSCCRSDLRVDFAHYSFAAATFYPPCEDQVGRIEPYDLPKIVVCVTSEPGLAARQAKRLLEVWKEQFRKPSEHVLSEEFVWSEDVLSCSAV